jgi:hypothetical protein
MSRKDYRALAEALKGASATPQVIAAVSRVLADDNPRFDWQKFALACGINN